MRDSLPHEVVAFAHNSERQFAKLLDFYRIQWKYEPTTFDVEWDSSGKPAKRFAPDFYLPEFDLYIEITTLNQKLVTKKNRKARRLAELYPGVRCKVLYQRDYLNLLVKYGLEEPSQGALVTATNEESVEGRRAEIPSGGLVGGEVDLASSHEDDKRSLLGITAR